ncbi:YdaU family protein [Komagataeibacter oboediens]|uniref:YdaU family protein n=1 Tax=Komagataeibacter oboediens TaxID=65958 RepID=UPI000A046B91|nr:DUF1376 domain-containing protein [Komagataeibacter oboediens]
MSKTKTWMPLYIGDYLADTAGLSTLQHGAYILLMMDIWRNGPAPNNPHRLARIAKMDMATWEGEVWPELSHFFIVNDDGLLDQKRLRAEKNKAEEVSARLAKAAQEREQRKRARRENKKEQPENGPFPADNVSTPVPRPCHDGGTPVAQSQSQSHNPSFQSGLAGADAPHDADNVELTIDTAWRPLVRQVQDVAGYDLARLMPSAADGGEVRQWLADITAKGHSVQGASEIILMAVSGVMERRREQGPPNTLRYFRNAAAEMAEATPTRAAARMEAAYLEYTKVEMRHKRRPKSWTAFQQEWSSVA